MADIPPAPLLAPVSQPLTLRTIFFADTGANSDATLRPGWSLALYILILVTLFGALDTATLRLAPHHPHTASYANPPLPALLREGLLFLCVSLATWIMSRIERRPIAAYGTGGIHKLRHLAAGLAWGLVCLSLLVATLWRTHYLLFDRRLLFGADILRCAAQWSLVFLFVALFEEYLMRGYLQFTLARALTSLYALLLRAPNAPTLGFWTAAILLCTLFGLGHSGNPGESPIGLLSAGLAGLVFCLALWRTGSLWWAIGFHATWDWAQSFLYGVADSGTMAQGHLLDLHPSGAPLLSGGTTGPEGSIFILPIFVIIAAIILLTIPSPHRAPGS